MGMLSTQVDELRELATRCNELQVGAVRAIKGPLEMGSILRDAADTIDRLNTENAKLREYIAVSIPLPLDGNLSAIHPDDIIGNNVGGTDFFRRVTEMYLTRYPRDGQPAVWVVRTEDDNGNVFPYVCWGGRCNAVHKQASQTYSAEYLETYDENKQLKAENAKLRELAKAVREFTEGICCNDCPMARDCEDNNMIACHEKLSYHAFCGLRELGGEVEVDDG